jgi:hypothetical protein
MQAHSTPISAVEPASGFLEAAAALLARIEATQSDALAVASRLCADAIAAGGLVHLFGSGHSRIPVEEMFPRYGSYPGFNPIVELSMTFHTQVVGANGQRQAMFIERVEGLAEAILANFELAPAGWERRPSRWLKGRDGAGFQSWPSLRRRSRSPGLRDTPRALACSTTRTWSSTSALRRATRWSPLTASRHRSGLGRRSPPLRSPTRSNRGRRGSWRSVVRCPRYSPARPSWGRSDPSNSSKRRTPSTRVESVACCGAPT